jgi:hypothetical protein
VAKKPAARRRSARTKKPAAKKPAARRRSARAKKPAAKKPAARRRSARTKKPAAKKHPPPPAAKKHTPPPGGACNACNAFMSFSTKGTTIKELTPPLVIPMGFAMSGRLTLFGKSCGMKVTMSLKTFEGEFDMPVINIGPKGSKALQIFKSKTDKKRGPFIKMKYTVGSLNFIMAFSAYLKVPYIGEAEVAARISATAQRLSIKRLNIFGFLQATGYVETSISSKPTFKAEIQLYIPVIHKALTKLCAMAKKGIIAIRNAVNKVFNSINRRLKSAQNKLRSAQNKLNGAKRKCDKATNKLRAKKRSCPREESMYLGEDDDTEWGRRRRRVFKAIRKVAKKAVKVVKKAAGSVCRGVLKGLAKAANAVCKAPMHVASGLLCAAQAALKGIQRIVNMARAVVNQVLKIVLDVVKFLSQFILQETGFKMDGAKASVNFSAKFLINKKPRKFNFGFSLKGGSLTKIVAQMFKTVFKAIKDAAMKTLTNLKKKIFKMEEEAIEVERQAEEMRQQTLEEGREMERERLEEEAEEAEEAEEERQQQLEEHEL